MTKGPQQKAPDGKWGMPSEALAAALGYFVLGWSAIESTIEVAIAKQLGLSPVDSSIATASLGFKSRSEILMSLLNRDPKANRAAIEALKEIKKIEDRNDILHSVIGGSENLIWFNRRTTGATLKSRIERYDRERLMNVTLRCSDLATALGKALGITGSDHAKFFQEAHNSANKL